MYTNMYIYLFITKKTVTFALEKNKLIMATLTVKDFRSNLAASFDKAANNENVFIRRKNEIYALVKIGNDDLMLTPEMQERIKEVEKSCRDGLCVTCSTKEDLDSYLDSL